MDDMTQPQTNNSCKESITQKISSELKNDNCYANDYNVSDMESKEDDKNKMIWGNNNFMTHEMNNAGFKSPETVVGSLVTTGNINENNQNSQYNVTNKTSEEGCSLISTTTETVAANTKTEDNQNVVKETGFLNNQNDTSGEHKQQHNQISDGVTQNDNAGIVDVF